MLKKSRRVREQPMKLTAIVAAVWLATLCSLALFKKEAPVPPSTIAAVYQLAGAGDARRM